jgi:phage tail P2-like protein
MSKTLLPPNSTDLEEALDLVVAQRIEALRAEFARRLDPDECSPSDLTYLSEVAEVFVWDEAWPDERKRAAIKNTMYLRTIRGTIGAVKKGLIALEVEGDVVPWWKDEENIKNGTFEVFAWANDNIASGNPVLSAEKFALIRDVVDALKPLKSRYAIRIGIKFETSIAVVPVMCVTKMMRATVNVVMPEGG